jgi:excisionase family DNA binding protein
MGYMILLTEQQAAERLTVAVKTLQAWRVRGGGPKFVKLGRSVRYTEQDLEEYVRAHTVAHTAAVNDQARCIGGSI